MVNIAAVLEEAQEEAASVFEEKEYLTTFGSTGDGDPWDEATVDKAGWVEKIVNVFSKYYTKPEVRPTMH